MGNELLSPERNPIPGCGANSVPTYGTGTGYFLFLIIIIIIIIIILFSRTVVYFPVLTRSLRVPVPGIGYRVPGAAATVPGKGARIAQRLNYFDRCLPLQPQQYFLAAQALTKGGGLLKHALVHKILSIVNPVLGTSVLCIMRFS